MYFNGDDNSQSLHHKYLCDSVHTCIRIVNFRLLLNIRKESCWTSYILNGHTRTSFPSGIRREEHFTFICFVMPLLCSDYAKLMQETGVLEAVVQDDWTKPTIDSWRHSIWVGVFDPWPVVIRYLVVINIDEITCQSASVASYYYEKS